MDIAAWIILLLAILPIPILLIRFRKRWVAAFNLAVTNRIKSRFAAPVARLRHPYTRGSKVKRGLPDASQCFSSAGGISHCAHLTDG